MVFSSTTFLFVFLAITLALYYLFNFLLKKTPVRIRVLNGILLAASLVFYAWGEPKYVLLMLLSIVVNFVFGILMGAKDDNDKLRKLFLILSVVFNVGMLFFFKYFMFVTDIITAIMGKETNIFTEATGTAIALPIGISFFTFQIMSYVIDVYRRKVNPQKNIFRLGLYISLFPQLIAGPIVRYIDIDQELADRSVTLEGVYEGMCRFILGLAKKALIANTVAQISDTIFSMDTIQISSATAWLGAICYTLQIYFDFSGYSDMAIGLGRMFGFHFLENFNYPYISSSVKEFWRRWHISLSSWFRDYLYIPLGGNRKGKVRTQINVFLVWLCTGFWHGAAFTFIAWGLYYWLLLTMENLFLGKAFEKFENTFNKFKLGFIPKIIEHTYTIVAFLIGWVIFNSKDLPQAFTFVRRMFTFSEWGWDKMVSQLSNLSTTMLLLGILFSIPIVPAVRKKLEGLKNGDVIVTVSGAVISMALFVLAILFITGSGYNPFIYFRF